MPYLPLRSLPPRPSQALTSAWLERLADRLAGCTGDVAAERSVVCRETLAELAYPEYAAELGDGGCGRVGAARDPPGAHGARSASRDAGARVLQRLRRRAVPAGEAAALALVLVRPAAARRPEHRAGGPASTAARAVHLQAVRQELQSVPARRVHVRLQPRGGRRRGGAPARAARRPGRDPDRQQGLDQRLREHLQPHAQHRRAGRRDERADGAGGRRARDVPRDGAGRRARERAGDGRCARGGDEGRAPVPRVRRDPGEERAREAERAGAGDDPADGGAALSRPMPEL